MFVERLNYDQYDNIIDCDLLYWRHDAIRIESLSTLSTETSFLNTLSAY